MTLTIAGYTGNISRLPSFAGTVCETRVDLLNRLSEVLANLGSATLQLTHAEDNGDLAQLDSAQYQIQKLRSDCSSIRHELEGHRARHHC